MFYFFSSYQPAWQFNSSLMTAAETHTGPSQELLLCVFGLMKSDVGEQQVQDRKVMERMNFLSIFQSSFPISSLSTTSNLIYLRVILFFSRAAVPSFPVQSFPKWAEC